MPAWKYGQLRMRKQSKHFDGVLGTDVVGIANHHQGGRLDRHYVLDPKVLELAHPFYALFEELWELLRMRRKLDVAVAQRFRHILELRLLHKLPERWVVPI